MVSKSETLQSLKAELESVNTTIEKYKRVRSALVEVITFLGNEELQDLLKQTQGEATMEEIDLEAEAEETNGDGSPNLPALPHDGIEAVRKALAARNRS